MRSIVRMVLDDIKQPEHIDAKELFDMLQVNLETRIKTFAKVVKTKQAFGSTSKSERNEIEDKKPMFSKSKSNQCLAKVAENT